MDRAQLRGMGVALITPFDENGEVDYESLRLLADYQVSNGAAFIVVLGTTGESPTIEESERVTIIDTVRQTIDGRCPLVVGAGGNHTMRLVKRLQEMDTTGVDAILSVAPYYNKPTQEGIYQHYKMLASATDLPVLLYNVPGRTGVSIKPETTLRLAADCPNIIGVKEASGSIEQVRAIISEKPADFIVLSGDDHLSLSFIKEGAEGVISVIGNAYPEQFSRLIRLSLEGRYEDAEILQQKLEGMYYLMFVDGNPAGVKELLHQKGLIRHNRLRLPLVPASDSTATLIARVRQQIEQAAELS